MSLFDPNDYLKGGSGTATAPAAEFDPVLYLSGRPQNEAKQPNGSPQQAEPSPVEAPIPPKRPKGLDWPKILNGKIEEIASRVSPEQAEALSRLPDPEAKAGAVMRAWAHDQYPQMRPDDIDHNWDTVRPLIAKNAFGVDNPKMSNSAFYGLVAKHTEEEQGFRASLPEALANVPTAAAKHLKEWYTKPAIELPEAPKDTPDIPGLGLQNPALWAGVYNGAVRPFVSFVESPEGMTFLAGGAELKALSEAYPAAKVALSGISGLFGYMMGSQTIKDAPEVVSIFKDPKSTFQQKVEVVSKEISNASLTLLASFGAIEELGGAKDLQTQLKGLDVSKSVEEIRTQALLHKDPKTSEALSLAADTLEETAGIRTPGQPPANAGEGLGWFEEAGPVQRAPGSTPLEPNPVVEQIRAAAIRLKTGEIREGGTHDWIRANYNGTEDGEPGFMTNQNRFVSREEGQQIAEKAGQVPAKTVEIPGEKPTELHSEDLPPAPPPIAKPGPGEPVDPVKETSLKNAVADLERKGYGLEEATPTERRAMADSWVRAAATLERYNGAGKRLAETLHKNPNIGLTDDESALLLRHKVGLENALNETIDIAGDENQSPELRAEAQKQASALSEELKDLLDAVHDRGSEWGREGRWRQAMAKEDYSFASQQRLLETAKGGAKLTLEEVDGLTKKLSELKAKNAELEAHLDSLRAQVPPEKAADRAIRELAKPPTRPRPSNVAQRMRAGLKDRATKARAEMYDVFRGAKPLTPGPKDFYNVSVIAADWIVDKGLDAAQWSSEMVKEFGDKIQPILADAWRAGVKLYNTELRSALLENFRSRGSSTVRPDFSLIAQDLARTFIGEGIKDRDAVVDAVWEQMKSLDPNVTRREAMDAISGYGKFKALTHDEITDQLRDIKGQLQQVAKIEDMSEGRAPAKTGQERREPSDEERALLKQVEEKKRQGGYDVTDRERQLRTALDAVKTRLKNQISDLEKQIAAREKIVKKKTGLVYDGEAESLRARRDELQDQFDEVFKEDDTSERNGRQKVALQKKIDELKAKIEAGDTRPEGLKMSRPAPPELEPLRQELDRLHDEMAELRGKSEVPLEKRLNQWKARATARVADLEEKLRTGDLGPAARKPPVALDKEGLKIQGQLDQLKEDLAVARSKAEEAAKPKWQRRLNTSAEIAREAAISGYHILGKIVAYTGWKIPETVATEGVGAIIKRTPGFAKVSAKANLEIGEEADGLSKFFTSMATEGMRDAAQVIRTGRSDLKLEVGNKIQNSRPIHWWNFSGLSHMAEKSLLFRGDFEMRLAKATAAAKRAGLDVTDGMVQAALRMDAGAYADKAILQEQNLFAQWVNNGLKSLEQIDPETKEVDRNRVILAWAIRTFVTKGIVKTPSNYIMQSFERTPISLVTGSIRLIRANKLPEGKFSAKEANIIAHCFKVGLVGTGMFIWGFVDGLKDPKDRIFGGYYQPGQKRDPDDVDFGKMRVNGHQLWHIATHSPITEPAQMGSTMARVMFSHVKGGEDRGMIAGAMAAVLALASSAPIANPITQIQRDVSEGRGDQILWDEIANLVPGLVQNVAQDIDPAKSRKAQGAVDTIKAKIPVLRKQLPERKPKGKGAMRTYDVPD